MKSFSLVIRPQFPGSFIWKNKQIGTIDMLLSYLCHLQGFVVSLEFPAKTLQLASGQDGSAMFTLQLVLFLDELGLSLLQRFQFFLFKTMFFQLKKKKRKEKTAMIIHFIFKSNKIFFVTLYNKQINGHALMTLILYLCKLTVEVS